jgi:hypothetical protein
MQLENEAPPQTNELLQRILEAVEPGKPKPKRKFEVVAAVVLSIATTASAWCAYQSKLWGGAQAARAGAGAAATREMALKTIAAMQLRAFDATMFIAYMQAHFETNQSVETFLANRFRPDFKPAVEAWLKLDGFNNPSAPPSPLHMAEYAQKELDEVARQQTIADQAGQRAREARRHSDSYVLLTVLFASVLFLAGFARAFESPRLSTALSLLSLTLFLITICAVAMMPICHE